MRRFLEILIPLLLPWLTYYIVRVLTRPKRAKESDEAGRGTIPWLWLLGIGIVLLVVSLFAGALLRGAPPGSVYKPATIENGQPQPGGFERPQ